jgi:hypothetical protein
MRRLAPILLLALAGCVTPSPPGPPPAPEAPAAAPEPAAPAVPAPEPAPAVPPPVTPEPPAAAPAGPGVSAREFIALNDTRLLDVYKGMPKVTVERLMAAHATERFANPYKRQALKTRDGSVYEIVFYLTREPLRGKPITENQLTPVIFRNDKVFAIGRYPLKKLRREAVK